MSSGKERLKVAVIKQFANQVAALFTGDLIGNVTGDVTGDVVGNVTGDLTGDVTGDVTGDLTGDVTGNITGYQTFGTATAYDGASAPNLVVSPDVQYASLTKGSAGAYTLAAPGAGNVGNRMVIIAGSAQAHVLTVTGLAGGNTLTFTAAIGAPVELLAVSATVWGLLSAGGAVQSNV